MARKVKVRPQDLNKAVYILARFDWSYGRQLPYDELKEDIAKALSHNYANAQRAKFAVARTKFHQVVADNEVNFDRAQKLLAEVEEKIAANWEYADWDYEAVRTIRDLAKSLRDVVGPPLKK